MFEAKVLESCKAGVILDSGGCNHWFGKTFLFTEFSCLHSGLL